MRGEDEAIELASGQHALVATWQLEAIGLGRNEIGRLRRSRNWTARSARVLARTGAPTTDLQAVMAAVLDASPGAVVSGTAAAWLWGLPGFRPMPVHVVRPRGVSRRRSSLAVVHEVVDLFPGHVKIVDRIAVVSPPRVAFEVCGSHPHRAARVLDRLWSEHLLDGRGFRRTVGELAASGRKGSTLARELDAARGPGYVPPASGLEGRFIEVLERYGLPAMRRQVDLGDEESWCGRVDFLDVSLPLIAEIQSEKYHEALVDKAADARRRERLERAGFVIAEIRDADVWYRPHLVADRLRDARRQLRGRAA